MNAVAAGVMALDADFEEAMSFCLNCRACEAVCPSLVPYGRAMEGARAEVAVQRPRLGRKVRHFALGRLLPNRRLVALVTMVIVARATTPAPTLVAREVARRASKGSDRSGRLRLAKISERRGRSGRAALLRGCVMEPWFGEVNRAAETLLTRAGYEVVVTAESDLLWCAGGSRWGDARGDPSGRQEHRGFRGLRPRGRNRRRMQRPPARLRPLRRRRESRRQRPRRHRGCRRAHRGGPPAATRPAARRRSLSRTRATSDMPRGSSTAPRTILTAAGYTAVEIDPDGICCGAAGIYSLLRPEASAELGRRKADQVRASGADLVASANPGCELQLRSQLGGTHRIAHPIELYLEALSDPGG